jgi:hypothetical protein
MSFQELISRIESVIQDPWLQISLVIMTKATHTANSLQFRIAEQVVSPLTAKMKAPTRCYPPRRLKAQVVANIINTSRFLSLQLSLFPQPVPELASVTVAIYQPSAISGLGRAAQDSLNN